MMDYPQELLDLLEPGTKVRVVYQKGNINNQVRHIRAIVDEVQVVYRTWSYTRKSWNYHVDWMYAFQLLWKDGYLRR